MPYIHFGVNDVPYAGQLASRQQRRLTRSQRTYSRGKTTGQVMDRLEKKYGIIEEFVEQEKELIASIIEKAVAKAVARDTDIKIPASDLKMLESKFKQAIVDEKFNGLPGVPTKAAIAGISHKFMHPYAKRGSRPSFIDTELFRRNLRVWFE
jgi:hypothetical protein